MTTHANDSVHVCQRCCNPLKLHPDLDNLNEEKISALVDAQRPESEDSRPPMIVTVKNVGSNYPRYRIPPNLDAELPASLQRYSTPATSLDHRQKVSAKLFDLLSGRTEVDHPLCYECADVLITAKRQCIEHQEDELNCLRTYMSYLDAKAAKAEAKLKQPDLPESEQTPKTQIAKHRLSGEASLALLPGQTYSSFNDDDESSASNWLSCLSLTEQPGALMTWPKQAADLGNDSDVLSSGDESTDDDGASVSSNRATRPHAMRLSELRKQANQLQDQLKDVLAEGVRLDKVFVSDSADLERRTEELDKAQTQYNEQKQSLLELEQEMLSLQSRVKHAERHLKRLLRTNVLNTTFPIWYDEHFCIINGLHLGRLPNQPISWEEINAAWGQCAMLLQCMARKLNHTFVDYRVVPVGSQSKVQDLTNHKEYPLYYPTSGMQFFGVSKFDNAMCIFLKCLQQIQQIVEDWTQTKLPYCIKESGKIHDHNESKTYSIKWSGNSEENWTKALKMMLINMKWIIARLAAMDGKRANAPNTSTQTSRASMSARTQ